MLIEKEADARSSPGSALKQYRIELNTMSTVWSSKRNMIIIKLPNRLIGWLIVPDMWQCDA